MPASRPHDRLLLLLLTGILLSGCGAPLNPAARPEDGALDATPSPTPFGPAPPSATPRVLRVWLSPALPDPLLQAALAVRTAAPGRIELVDEPGQATIRFEPDGERLVAEWVYAVVVPFPSFAEDETLAALRGRWPGDGELLSTPATALALEAVLGVPDEVGIRSVSGDQLLEMAWAERQAMAIVPFEALEPRWRVLQVDGQSPLGRDFNPEAYPLIVRFGMSGDPADSAELVDLMSATDGWIATNRDPDRLTVVVMTGVTALTRATAWRMDTRGVSYPGLAIGDWLRGADLTHTSHEVAFADNCPPADPGQASLRFCSDPRNVALFESVGIDLIELTGNHVMDWGSQAFLFTLDLYRARGLGTFAGGEDDVAAAQPYLFEHHGNRLAFLGCNAAGPGRAWATPTSPGAARCDPEADAARVSRLREQGYLPVFTFQWPESYRPAPLPDQVAGFRGMIDAGAAIVSGSQAHRPQSFEFYGGGLIHYGLGNLFFDQMWSEATRQELIDRHVFYAGRHISTEVLTAYLEDYAQPRPMTPEERAALLDEIFRASGW
jgi:hypothetical protein